MNGNNKLPRVPVLKCEYKCGRDSTGVIKGKYMCADCYLDRNCGSEVNVVPQAEIIPYVMNLDGTIAFEQRVYQLPQRPLQLPQRPLW